MLRKLLPPILFLTAVSFSQTDSIALNTSDVQNDISQTQISDVSVNRHLTILIGAAQPMSPMEFSDYWNTGYILSISDSKVTDKFYKFGLNLDIGFFSFNEENFLEENDFSSSGVSIDVAPVFLVRADATAKIYFIPSLKIPYATGSIGLCGLFGGESTIEGPYSSINLDGVDDQGLLASIGAGFDIPMFNAKIYAQAEYSMMIGLGGVTSYIPIRCGVRIPTTFSFFDSL